MLFPGKCPHREEAGAAKMGTKGAKIRSMLARTPAAVKKRKLRARRRERQRVGQRRYRARQREGRLDVFRPATR
jgi:hypothetical protein